MKEADFPIINNSELNEKAKKALLEWGFAVDGPKNNPFKEAVNVTSKENQNRFPILEIDGREDASSFLSRQESRRWAR